MEASLPEAFAEFKAVCDKLEAHYRDVQDLEFTIERGKLWMLQTRSGKRTAKAALKIAVDMVDEGIITKDAAVKRIAPASLDQLSGSGLSSDRIIDPWGTPIEYTLVSEGAGFALTSAGPDGALATSDDYSITFDGNTVRVILNGQEHDLDGLADILNGR